MKYFQRVYIKFLAFAESERETSPGLEGSLTCLMMVRDGDQSVQ